MSARLLITCALLGGCSQLQVSDTLPRAAGEAGVLEPPLDVAWTVDVGGACGPDAPQIHDGALIVGTRDGHVSVIEIQSGQLLGKGDFDGAVEGTIGMTDSETLIVPIAKEKVGIVAHDLERGKRVWTLEAGTHVAGVLLLEDRVITAGYDGTIRALAPETGELMWETRTDSTAGYRVAPVLTDAGHFLVANDAGVVSLRDVSSGDTVWTMDAGGPVLRPIGVSGGTVYIPSARGHLTSIEVASQALAFEKELGQGVRVASPLVDRQRVYAGTSDGQFLALDVESGETLWSHTFDAAIDARPAASGGTVFVPTLNRKLHALDASDGSHVWTTSLPGRIKTNLVTTGNLLLVCREPHHVVAFRSHTVAVDQ